MTWAGADVFTRLYSTARTWAGADVFTRLYSTARTWAGADVLPGYILQLGHGLVPMFYPVIFYS